MFTLLAGPDVCQGTEHTLTAVVQCQNFNH
jgi:hypothetical protein